jgi:hypothetical protein
MKENNNEGAISYSNERNNLRQFNSMKKENNNNEIINTNRPIKQITIKYCCLTPYFEFGKSIFFFCPKFLDNLKLSDNCHSNTIDLYQIPDPPFSIGIKCKYFLLFILILR